MDEYKNIVSGPLKVYIHKQQFIITENGDILLLRFSYDRERCFIRSICLVVPTIDNFDRKIKMKKISLDVKLSKTAEERYEQLLGVDEMELKNV